MGDFVTLTCPTCGGKLQITPEIDRFACTHCGNEHFVKRSEGVIAIRPLAESITGLKRATDRTASELAIRRLTDELNQLQAARQQAEGKAAESRKVIAAHTEYSAGCQAAIGGSVILPVCYLGYLAADVYSETAPAGSFLLDLPNWILFLMAVLALGVIAAFLKWLVSSEPKPARGVAEENLRAAEAELATLTRAMSQKQAEIAQHKQMVSLGG
jgi:DNA-directed RNA polymerase subunit RPC12/RpoP